jgi:hypothetical protein
VLSDELSLVLFVSNVFDYRIGQGEVHIVILEWHLTAVCDHEGIGGGSGDYIYTHLDSSPSCDAVLYDVLVGV